MNNFNLLNTDDIRFLRYYTRYLHYKFDCVWSISNINNYSKKSLTQNLVEMLEKLKNQDPSGFYNHCLTMNECVKNDLLDISLFEWINSDRADCFTWSLLKAGRLRIESEYNTPKSTLRYRKKHAHICFNTNANILNYITWSFDDYDNSYFIHGTYHSNNLKRFGASQRKQERVLKEYKERFRYVHDTNNVSWINANNLEQTSWMYSYILKEKICEEFKRLNELNEFYYITPPNNEAQHYATVVAQLDMICDIYSDRTERWDEFSRKLKKAWSTQSDRLKVKNKEVTLDKESIKMLRDLVDKDASDVVLKKKLKDLIKVEHAEHKENLRRDKFNKRFKLPTQNVDSHSDV